MVQLWIYMVFFPQYIFNKVMGSNPVIRVCVCVCVCVCVLACARANLSNKKVTY